jgi:hypothetical protein
LEEHSTNSNNSHSLLLVQETRLEEEVEDSGNNHSLLLEEDLLLVVQDLAPVELDKVLDLLVGDLEPLSPLLELHSNLALVKPGGLAEFLGSNKHNNRPLGRLSNNRYSAHLLAQILALLLLVLDSLSNSKVLDLDLGDSVRKQGNNNKDLVCKLDNRRDLVVRWDSKVDLAVLPRVLGDLVLLEAQEILELLQVVDLVVDLEVHKQELGLAHQGDLAVKPDLGRNNNHNLPLDQVDLELKQVLDLVVLLVALELLQLAEDLGKHLVA